MTPPKCCCRSEPLHCVEMLSQEAPESVERPPYVVQEAWQQSIEARGIVNNLLRRNKRRTFGLLEKPGFDRRLPVLHQRLYLAGKSGIGKTSTVHKLMGRDIPQTYEETLGIQTNVIYWPTKLVNPRKVLILQLELWDVGDKASTKFTHLRPTSVQATDGIMYFFSYADRHSWDELPNLMSSLSRGDPNALKVIVGTHADSTNCEVTEAEVEQFQDMTKLVVLPISNTNGPRLSTEPTSPDGREGIKAITPFMNALTQILLSHERKTKTELSAVLDGWMSNLSPDTESPSQ